MENIIKKTYSNTWFEKISLNSVNTMLSLFGDRATVERRNTIIPVVVLQFLPAGDNFLIAEVMKKEDYEKIK